MSNKLLFTDEQFEALEDLAACNYPPQSIALYFDLSKDEFMKVWKDKDSLIRYHYNRGKLVADFEIAQKRLQNARNGNLTADQIHVKETKQRRLEDLKEQVLFG